MSRINEKLGLKPAGRRRMMHLPKDKAAAAVLTAARCPACNRTGVIENVIKGERRRLCTWCGEAWSA